MSAEWNPGAINPQPPATVQPVREAQSGTDAPALDTRDLDLALDALARECHELEPPAWLESRIVAAAAREQEAAMPSIASAGTNTAGSERGGWFFWRSAAWTLATAALLAGLLWVPSWLAIQDLPESPLPGIARINAVVLHPPVAAETTPTATLTRTPVAQVTRAGAKPRTARRASVGQRSGLASVPEIAASDKPGEPGALAASQPLGLPSMGWPVEVLAAARQMVARPEFGTAAGYGTEVPLQSVRVSMGADDLWRMGLASTPAARNQAVLADFLVTEDGRPLAVRLVGVYP